MFTTNPSLMVVYCHVVIFAETMDRDLEKEELLGDIIRIGGDVFSFSMIPMVKKERMPASVIQQWGRNEIIMAPVTEWRRKKEIMMMAPVTERRRQLLQSPARYIY